MIINCRRGMWLPQAHVAVVNAYFLNMLGFDVDRDDEGGDNDDGMRIDDDDDRVNEDGDDCDDDDMIKNRL